MAPETFQEPISLLGPAQPLEQATTMDPLQQKLAPYAKATGAKGRTPKVKPAYRGLQEPTAKGLAAYCKYKGWEPAGLLVRPILPGSDHLETYATAVRLATPDQPTPAIFRLRWSESSQRWDTKDVVPVSPEALALLNTRKGGS